MTRPSFGFKLFYEGKTPGNKLNRMKNDRSTKEERVYIQRQKQRIRKSPKAQQAFRLW